MQLWLIRLQQGIDGPIVSSRCAAIITSARATRLPASCITKATTDTGLLIDRLVGKTAGMFVALHGPGETNGTELAVAVDYIGLVC